MRIARANRDRARIFYVAMLSNGKHMKGATERWAVERVFVPVDCATQEANLQRLHALLLRGAKRLGRGETGDQDLPVNCREGGNNGQ